MRLRPEQRLRRQLDIRAVREQGARADCRAFTVWYRRRADETSADESSPASGAPADLLPSLRVGDNAPHPRVEDPSSLGGAAASNARHPRAAVIASKASVGGAVQRNRAKRRLRELFRSQQHLLPSDCDLLLVARASVNHSDFADLRARFIDACARISGAKR